MTVWKNAVMQTFYADETVSDDTPCEVRIADSEIAVSWKSEQGPILWRGTEIPKDSGHFELSSPTGRAILHRSPDSDEVVGRWIAEREEGMCRIDLGETD
jgi:hypothetical protein